MKTQESGWVILRKSGEIQFGSFHRTRKEAIAWMIEGSRHSWDYWYQYGLRCVKATQTIETA